ncbi:MAG: desulfoferrodoxin [Candidatus Aenigmatarchaeota archaeon]|nr:desulfoferrodoxin [Candidatus Aenigmarchaeota archaeon]
MTELGQVYKCQICGNIVSVMHAGIGILVCCGQPMVLLKEKIEEEGKEKHLPVVTINKNNIHVKVGSIEHPMESNHYIEWIEVITENKKYIKFLSPGSKPEADFEIKDKIIAVREYCNVHGLWKKIVKN